MKSEHKTDSNSSLLASKIDLRKRVLSALAAAHVFEACTGLHATMWRKAWSAAASWTGCDEKPWTSDQPERYVCDHVRLLRHLNLSAFNVFDFDTYGSPWELAVILAKRRTWGTGERGALVLTDGSSLKSRWKHDPGALAWLLGRVRAETLAGNSRDKHAAALQAWMKHSGVKPVTLWQAFGFGTSQMIYSALMFEGA